MSRHLPVRDTTATVWNGLLTHRPWGLGLMLGLLTATGQAPLGLWPLSLIAWTLLFVTIGPRQPFHTTLWVVMGFGMGHTVLMAPWIVQPFLVHAQADAWMGPWAWLILCAIIALFWTPVALVLKTIAHTPTRVLAGGWLFVLGDEARGHLGDLSFRWGLIGHVWENTPLLALARHGETVMALFTVTLTGGLALLWLGHKKTGLATLLTALSAVGFLLTTPVHPYPPFPSLTVRVVQPHVPQNEKWRPELAQHQQQQLLNALQREEESDGVDLFVFPESASPFAIDTPDFDTDAWAQALQTHGPESLALIGANVRQGTRWHNGLHVINARGEVVAQHLKHRLVPFGEHIPFSDILGDSVTGMTGQRFSQGPTPQALTLPNGLRIWPIICYESIFPIRQDQHNTFDVIVMITNDSWIGTAWGPRQHLTAARIRAVETGRPVIRVGNQGVSAVIWPSGEVQTLLPQNTQGHATFHLGDLNRPPPLQR